MSKIKEVYKFDDEKQIWKRPDAEPFAYADGIEPKLMEYYKK